MLNDLDQRVVDQARRLKDQVVHRLAHTISTKNGPDALLAQGRIGTALVLFAALTVLDTIHFYKPDKPEKD